MYTVTRQGDILEVHEQSFSALRTKHTWWYFDVKNNLRSLRGLKDEKPDHAMTQDDIDWVTKHYLPKAAPHI